MASGYTYKINKGEDSLITVNVEVENERFLTTQEHVFKELSEEVKIPGFRPGKAPKAQIEAKLGPTLFNETIKHLVSDISAEIVETEKLNPLTNLQYDLQTAGGTEGVKYSFHFTNYPEVKLGNLNKIKIKKEVKPVSEKDIDGVIQRIFRSEDEKELPHAPTDKEIQELQIEGVENMTGLRKHIEGRLLSLNDSDAQRDYEQKLIEAAVEASDVPVPQALIEEQAHAMLHDYMHRLESLNISIADFLAAQGTTEEELHEQYHKDAEKRIAADLLMNEIVRNHELIPTAEDIEAQIESIDDDQLRATYDSGMGRRQVLSILIHQRGMQQLRELVGEPEVITLKPETESKAEKKSGAEKADSK